MERRSVLIADDNADTLELWQCVFEVEGFAVTTAENGRRALEQLGRARPDVVVTDLMMPQVSGLELIRRVRDCPQWADIPIIAVSAYPEHYLREARRAGATRVMSKPLEFEELIEAVNRCFAESRRATDGDLHDSALRTTRRDAMWGG